MRKIFKKAGIFVGLFVAITYANFIAPQTYNTYLRWEVGESVVQVLRPDLRGGGTGFAVKADSGDEYIATNHHVCNAAENGWVVIKRDGKEGTFKRVIYKDSKADLCLIQGDKRLAPLTIGSDPEKGDLHYIVGHPGLRQLTISKGEFIGFDIVRLLDQVKTRGECRGLVQELSKLGQLMYGVEFVCIRSYKSYASTAIAFGGNSGSPVVNKYGNVIGILFAGTNQVTDSYLVPVYELRRVLSKF
jgi:S1-C subfamily serine protease